MYRNGLALQRYRPQQGEAFLPIVKIAQLRSGVPNNDERASVDITPECVIDDGDVVFSWSGTLMVKIWTGGQAALNQHLFKVTSVEFPKWFYYHWTLLHLPEFSAIASGKATTMGHIKRHHLADAMCVVAPAELLNKVGRILYLILERVVNCAVEARHLASTRDVLLPDLLSRRIDATGVRVP
jgi:type I restriction enzyme S subunit